MVSWLTSGFFIIVLLDCAEFTRVGPMMCKSLPLAAAMWVSALTHAPTDGRVPGCVPPALPIIKPLLGFASNASSDGSATSEHANPDSACHAHRMVWAFPAGPHVVATALAIRGIVEKQERERKEQGEQQQQQQHEEDEEEEGGEGQLLHQHSAC